MQLKSERRPILSGHFKTPSKGEQEASKKTNQELGLLLNLHPCVCQPSLSAAAGLKDKRLVGYQQGPRKPRSSVDSHRLGPVGKIVLVLQDSEFMFQSLRCHLTESRDR